VPRTSFFYPREAVAQVAKTSPGEFIRQVRSEMSKVVWPTSKETITTAIMVVMMTAMLALFFFGIDAVFSSIVKALLGLLG
jgi:preprotein translocase subunit SecE